MKEQTKHPYEIEVPEGHIDDPIIIREPVNNKELTPEEQNLIKDILKRFGNKDTVCVEDILRVSGLNKNQFDSMADSIFNKLQNGRVTVLND